MSANAVEIPELRITCQGDESKGVLEFGEGAHASALIASQVREMQVKVNYAFNGYEGYLTDLMEFHRTICVQRRLQFIPRRHPRLPTEDYTPPSGTTEKIPTDGEAHLRI